MSFKAAALGSFALILLFSSAYAQGQCTSTQLPNVLALGTCLGLNPDYCSNRPENATMEVIRIFTCVFRMMPQVTGPIQTLFYLRAVITAVMSRVQTDQDPVAVASMMCRPFGLPLFQCEDGFPNNITCGPPVNISLPSSFGIRDCMNSSRLVCMEGERLRNETMTELINFLVCLMSRSPGDGDTLAGRLACTLAQLVQFSAQQFAATFPLPMLTTGMQISANRLSTELAMRARCF
uniref:24 kDa family member n=1 Tax=Rhipicephalus zambeziensis TaxID=60191 RepID=A0A224YGN3_9ACAR